MKRVSLIALTTVATLSMGRVDAAAMGYAKEFSAEQTQVSPQGESVVVRRIYVGATQVRYESVQGQKMVDIIDFSANKAYRIFPDSGSYMEMTLPPQMARSAGGVDERPCAEFHGIECSKLGEESINGRIAERWQFLVPGRDGKQVTTEHWIDKERRFPVRHELPNGARYETRLVGTETLEGRTVEKWQTVILQNGKREEANFWFDPELKLRIREEMPSGGRREMDHIQVGSPAAELFRVPEGMRRVEPQQPPQGGAPGRY